MLHQTWQLLAFGAILLNVFGYVWQTLVIASARSGDRVSLAAFISAVGIEIVNIIYGKTMHDGWFALNGFICLAGQLLVLGFLSRHKIYKTWERALSFSWLGVIGGAFLLPFPNAVQLLANGLNFLGGLSQPVELAAGRGTGAMAILSLLGSFASAVIWTLYCRHFGMWGPEVGFAGYAAVTAVNIGIWAYKKWSASS